MNPEAAFWIIFIVALAVMGAAWWATRIATRWRHQREDYQAVIRNLHKLDHPHTHQWMKVGFIDDHPIIECWICHVEQPYEEGESER